MASTRHGTVAAISTARQLLMQRAHHTIKTKKMLAKRSSSSRAVGRRQGFSKSTIQRLNKAVTTNNSKVTIVERKVCQVKAIEIAIDHLKRVPKVGAKFHNNGKTKGANWQTVGQYQVTEYLKKHWRETPLQDESWIPKRDQFYCLLRLMPRYASSKSRQRPILYGSCANEYLCKSKSK